MYKKSRLNFIDLLKIFISWPCPIKLLNLWMALGFPSAILCTGSKSVGIFLTRQCKRVKMYSSTRDCD